MFHRARGVYGRLRRAPVIGMVASRLVWGVKGALGRPIRSPDPPVAAAEREARLQTRLQIATAVMEGLAARLARDPTIASVAHPLRRPPFGRMTFSVIVNTYDRAPHLRRALAAITQLRHPAFEVIVVNGPSTDDTAAVLEAYAGRIRTARCPELNLAMSRNIGLALARGEIVAFIDDDAIPEPDWLDALEPAYADPRVGGAGGSIRDPGGIGFQCRLVAADRLGDSHDYESLAAAEAELGPLGGHPGASHYLSLTGANSSFRRTAIAAIGGFDEAYAYFLDETDVCLRLVDSGYTLACAPTAEVHHAYAESHLRQADRTPKHIQPCVRSTAYFGLRNGLSSLGLERVSEHLADYATGLKAEMGWRRAHDVIDDVAHDRMLREIDIGLAEGVRAAVARPRRLAPAPLDERRTASFYPFRALLAPAERLRLCLLSQQYPPGAVGGIGVWTEALAKALSSRGHEVTVITRSAAGAASVVFVDGVWVHRIGPRAHCGPIAAPFDDLPPTIAGYSLAVLDELCRIDERRSFDLVMGPIWDVEPAAVLALGRWPTVVSLHTPYALSIPFQPGWESGGAYRAAHVDKVIAAERAMLTCAPAVLADSRAIIEDMARAYGLPELAACAAVIPHGLPDLAMGVLAPPRESGTVEVLFVGRLEPRKGVDLLLEIAPRVLAAMPNVRFTIVGDDTIPVDGATLRQRFERRWKGSEVLRRITFTGAVERDELLRRYAGCDLFVAPSRYESFGLTLVEAMIFAKPCVACCAGATPEVVVDGETGLLAPVDDGEALTDAVLQLVRDPDRRAAMGRAGRTRYEAYFTAERMSAAVAGFLLQVRDRENARRLCAVA